MKDLRGLTSLIQTYNYILHFALLPIDQPHGTMVMNTVHSLGINF